jgi:hypothetical protein
MILKHVCSGGFGSTTFFCENFVKVEIFMVLLLVINNPPEEPSLVILYLVLDYIEFSILNA